MDDRKLVYTNIANGCSVEQVADAFGLTLEEVEKIFSEVALKLSAHLVFSSHPFVACMTHGDAMQNRMLLIPQLESLNLDAGLIERVKRVRHSVTRATR